MSDFQKKLNEEIEKRGEETPADEKTVKSPKPAKKKKKKKEKRTVNSKKSFFSFASFVKGILIGVLFFLVIAGWAWFKKDDTQIKIKSRLASKTAIVEKDTQNTYRISDAQTVLTMPKTNVVHKNTEENPSENNNAAQQNKSVKSLVPAPVPGLYESVSEGLLPRIRTEDNLTPFNAYKRPFQRNGEKPLLSIIITDLGVSQKITESIISNFAPEISLAFSPYTKNLKSFTDMTREKGHEVWLTLPMETADYPAYDSGPLTLLLNASVEKNKDRLTSLLISTQGYAGFISQKDHSFKKEDAAVNPAIQEIFSRGLAIIDSNTSLTNFVEHAAEMKDYPYAKNNFWLDEDLSPSALNQKIKQIIEYGKARGHVVLTLRPYPASLKMIQKFLNSPSANDFQLAPISAQASIHVSHGG